MPLLEEIFVPIKGYEGFYEISNKGKVKSLSHIRSCGRGLFYRQKERILKPIYGSDYNYCYVSLCTNGKMKHFLISRQVATAFINNPYNLPEVNHLDFDLNNNCDWNLEWCTRKQNAEYSSIHGRMRHGENHYMHKLTEKDVKEIRNNSDNLSIKELAKKYGIGYYHIYKLKNRLEWKHLV